MKLSSINEAVILSGAKDLQLFFVSATAYSAQFLQRLPNLYVDTAWAAIGAWLPVLSSFRNS